MSQDFLFLVFFSWISFPQAPDYIIRAVSNFFDSQIKVCHRCQWPVANGKNLQTENFFMISFGHLWVAELEPILLFRKNSKHVYPVHYDCFRFTINVLCKEEAIWKMRKCWNKRIKPWKLFLLCSTKNIWHSLLVMFYLLRYTRFVL